MVTSLPSSQLFLMSAQDMLKNFTSSFASSLQIVQCVNVVTIQQLLSPSVCNITSRIRTFRHTYLLNILFLAFQKIGGAEKEVTDGSLRHDHLCNWSGC